MDYKKKKTKSCEGPDNVSYLNSCDFTIGGPVGLFKRRKNLFQQPNVFICDLRVVKFSLGV